MKIGFAHAIAAAALAGAMAAAAPAVASGHHPAPPLLPPDIQSIPYSLAPPPDTFYPRPQSTATAPLPRVQSQVPVGRAGPGVTPYELLPNRP